MKAISLHQPWATFVAMGWKTIETRTHDRFKGLAGQRIGIHGAKKIDYAELLVNGYLRLHACCIQWKNLDFLTHLTHIGRGSIVATAQVSAARWAPNVDFVQREDWNKRAMCNVSGRFLLFLEDIETMKRPVPFRGRQGIFEIPDPLIEAGME